MKEKIDKMLEWSNDHFIFIWGTIAIADLLWLLENHLRKDD